MNSRSAEYEAGVDETSESLDGLLDCVRCYAEQWLRALGKPESDYQRGVRLVLNTAMCEPHETAKCPLEPKGASDGRTASV